MDEEESKRAQREKEDILFSKKSIREAGQGKNIAKGENSLVLITHYQQITRICQGAPVAGAF